MKFRFSIVIFDTPDTRVGIVGSVPSLGSWQASSCVPLQPTEIPESASFPTLFTATVNISEIPEPIGVNDATGELVFSGCSSTQGSGDMAPTSASSGTVMEKFCSEFEYKYIIWKDEIHASSVPTPKDDTFNQSLPCNWSANLTRDGFLYAKDDLDPCECQLNSSSCNLSSLVRARYKTPPFPHQNIIWEGRGPEHNRKIRATKNHIHQHHSLNNNSSLPTNTFGPENHTLCKKYWINSSADIATSVDGGRPKQNVMVYVLPPTHFLDRELCDSGLHNCEYIHTTRYYLGVKEARLMHLNRIVPRILVGTCPRRVEHFKELKEKHNVRTVLNLQTEEDIANHWPIESDNSANKNIENLRKLYVENGLHYIWLPTTDMSTPERGEMMAQAAWLLAGIVVANPDYNVYVHCNAGVGRAVACVTAFLHCCLGLGEVETALLMTARRPVAFVDFTALRMGKIQFDAKYGKALTCLPLMPDETDVEVHSVAGEENKLTPKSHIQ